MRGLIFYKWCFVATFFRTAKMLDKCIEANVKAASCYENSRSFFSAAKCYEQAGLLSRDLNDWDKMISFFEKACLYFREHNVPDTAALTYNRGAGYVMHICSVYKTIDGLYFH